jgi:predicted nucleotidyltransferase
MIIPELNPSMVVLFGSYAKGTAKEYSDIDVAVIVDEIPGDYLDVLTKLYKMRRMVDVRI